MKRILSKLLIFAICVSNFSFTFATSNDYYSADEFISTYSDILETEIDDNRLIDNHDGLYMTDFDIDSYESEDSANLIEEEEDGKELDNAESLYDFVSTHSELSNQNESVTSEATTSKLMTPITLLKSTASVVSTISTAEKTSYTVTWTNYDGTVLEVDQNQSKDSFPYFNGNVPEKKQDGSIYYTFAGWQPEVSQVACDITYTAVFEEADRKVEDGMEIGEFALDDSLLNIAIMTDPHVPYESRYSKFGSTNADLLKNRIVNAIDQHGAKAILVAGDVTSESRSEEYDLYNDIISLYTDKCDFVTAAGNHEFRFTIGGAWNRRSQFNSIYAPRWRTKMKTGLYFSQWLGDTHVVAIGDNYYDADVRNEAGSKLFNRANAWITSSEINWLENIVAKDDARGITTIILCHWPIVDTENGAPVSSSAWATQEAEKRIKSIVSSHDNAILFSGHTHAKVSSSLPKQVENGGMFVHAGALTSSTPTYVSMKQVETEKNTKKYEIKYILPTNESQTFTFTHDVPSYTVTFKNDDGSVLQTEECVYGEIPTYTSSVPKSKVDNSMFVGWTEKLAEVTGPKEYIAQYDELKTIKTEITSIDLATASMPIKSTYRDGEKFDPTGLTIRAKLESGDDILIEYNDDTKSAFRFNPDLSTNLTEKNKFVEIALDTKEDKIYNVVQKIDGIDTYVDRTAQFLSSKTLYTSAPVHVSDTSDDFEVLNINESYFGWPFDPDGLKIKVAGKEVEYNDQTKGDFKFNPDLNTTLTENLADFSHYPPRLNLTIEYKGQSHLVKAPISWDTLTGIRVDDSCLYNKFDHSFVIPDSNGKVAEAPGVRTVYLEGEKFKTSGTLTDLTIKLHYLSGRIVSLNYSQTDRITITPDRPLTVNDTEITISYLVDDKLVNECIIPIEVYSGYATNYSDAKLADHGEGSIYKFETFKPEGLKLFNNDGKEVAVYSDITKNSFSFNPSLDKVFSGEDVQVSYNGTSTAFTGADNIVITYNGLKYIAPITLYDNPIKDNSFKVYNEKDIKTEYNGFEPFNPSGLVFSFEYESGREVLLDYGVRMESAVRFNPGLDTNLNKSNENVEVLLNLSNVSGVYAMKKKDSVTGEFVDELTPIIGSSELHTSLQVKVAEVGTGLEILNAKTTRENTPFDPEGLKIRIVDEVIEYNDLTKGDFKFYPDLNTQLTRSQIKTGEDGLKYFEIIIQYKGISYKTRSLAKYDHIMRMIFEENNHYRRFDSTYLVLEYDEDTDEYKAGNVYVISQFLEGETFIPSDELLNENCGFKITDIYYSGKEVVHNYADEKSYFTITPNRPLTTTDTSIRVDYNNPWEFGSYQGFILPIKVYSGYATNYADGRLSFRGEGSIFQFDTFKPDGLKLFNTQGEEVVEYNADTKEDFTFNPSLDTEFSIADNKYRQIEITYKGLTYVAPITLYNNPVKSDSFKVSNYSKAKNKYKVGEKYNPTGLILSGELQSGKEIFLEYNDNTKWAFTFKPDLNTPLTKEDKHVDITISNGTVSYSMKQKIEDPINYATKTTELSNNNQLFCSAPIVVDEAVSEAQLTGQPQTVYNEGDKFKPSGLKIKISNNKIVSYSLLNFYKFKFTPGISTKLNTTHTKITVTYDNKWTVDIPITVNELPKTTTIINPPTKVSYTVGSKFKPNGLKIKLPNGNIVTYSILNFYKFSFTPSKTAKLKTSDTTITGTYEGKTFTIPITVN